MSMKFGANNSRLAICAIMLSVVEHCFNDPNSDESLPENKGTWHHMGVLFAVESHRSEMEQA